MRARRDGKARVQEPGVGEHIKTEKMASSSPARRLGEVTNAVKNQKGVLLFFSWKMTAHVQKRQQEEEYDGEQARGEGYGFGF